MSEITVGHLAKIVGVEINDLLEKLSQAGVGKTHAKDIVTDVEKNQLLSFIQGGVARSESITLKRKKSTKQLKVAGQNRRINLEVRKKRTLVKPKEVIEEMPTDETNHLEGVDDSVVKQESQVKEEINSTIKEDSVTTGEKDLKVEAAETKSESTDPIVNSKPTDEVKKDTQTQTPDPELTVEEPKEVLEGDAAKKGTTKVEKEEKQPAQGKKGKKAKERKKTLKTVADRPFEKGKSPYNRHTSSKKTAKFGQKKTDLSVVKTQKFVKPVEKVTIEIAIPEVLTISELAIKMAVKAAEIIKVLMKMGTMATINQAIDQETAVLVAEEMGYKYHLLKDDAIEDDIAVSHAEEDFVDRAPVVTIMGHVDHGKTSLLDYIRKTKVTTGEAGGITQHIGAYSVDTSKGKLTFLDTPGHEAFTSMRARGADCTDIVILVVAADDGVMPQTKEAIQHAKAAKVPIVVAINKIDKEESDPERVKNELSQHDIIPEDWGGDVMFVNVSALTGQGVDDLLEGVVLQSEVLELQAANVGLAKGVVVESRLDKGHGAVTTVLIQSGRLKKGDILLAGTEYGRVRLMMNDKGQKIDEAGPSMPVEIYGLSGVTNAGDDAISVSDEKKAREVALFRQQKQKEKKLQQQQANKLSGLFDRMGEEGNAQVLNVIVKADVQGSIEAIRDSLMKLSTKEVKVEVIANGIGGINSSDISLASASKAVVFGFNVRADLTARKQAENEGLELRYYSIIYDLIDDVKQAMSGLLSPEMKEQIIGTAEVREVFRSSKFGSIAGCLVIDGIIKRNNPIRVLRDQVVIYEGALESLKRFKEDATEVKKGLECGIGVKNYNDVKVGDNIEVFETVEVKREML